MKKTILTIVLGLLCLFFEATSQRETIKIFATITDENGNPIPFANIIVQGTKTKTISDQHGNFHLQNVPAESIFVISSIGYQTKTITGSKLITTNRITLQTDQTNLKELQVVSTGYQTISRGKTTGSFIQIDNKLFNRSTSTSIIDRLKDVVPGVYFQNKDPQLGTVSRYQNGKNSGITIRGESTFSASKEPLIILDNFPYEGEIKNINPNDIESITILKDASAASIWGANSGNGVIVINTKKGSLNQKMKVEFSSNFTMINKPDLYYSKNFLDAESYTAVEQFLYDKGFFNAQLNNQSTFPTVSPAVELMKKYSSTTNEQERSTIQQQLQLLKTTDVRKDYDKYVYREAIQQQYSLGIRGGSSNLSYSLSAGYDHNENNLVNNGYQRTSLNSMTTYLPVKNLEITAGINYSQNTTSNNNTFSFGSYLATGNPYTAIFPYASLADENGNSMPLAQGLRKTYIESTASKGYLDWNYRPLDEIRLADNTIKIADLLFRLSGKYRVTPQLSVQVQYQNERQMITDRNYRSVDTYYVRELINRYSNYNTVTGELTNNLPKGGILELFNANWYQNNLRSQLDYVQNFGRHYVNLLVGTELKELKTAGYNRISYGYNDQFGSANSNLNFNTPYNTSPAGSALLPPIDGAVTGFLTRYISYYTIGTYDYDHKYTINLSARKDGANLFGAKANDKITPLWSSGIGWNISNENFYDLNWLTTLRLRATYGFQGNTNRTASAFLTGTYQNDSDTGAPIINISTAPNPRLQWESIRNINLALDFEAKGPILSGSLELYQKNGRNLIQPSTLALQTGFQSYQANTASIETKGIDLTLNSQNLSKGLKWRSSVLFSAVNDKVIKYDAPRTAASIYGMTGNYAVGKPLNALFSYHWAGLNPDNGNPRGYLNGLISENYTGIIDNFHTDSLVYHGSKTPTIFGAVRNDFSYGNFNLSVNVSYRLGYYFNRNSTSLNYTDVIKTGQHQDYNSRWQQSGDELHTNVPSLSYPANANRNLFYQYSEVLVEKGDHIRLQDVRLSYELPMNMLKKLKMSQLNIFAYANNLGILWRANKSGIDPGAVGAGITYPSQFSLSFGIHANF